MQSIVSLLGFVCTLAAAADEPTSATVPLHIAHDRPFVDLEFTLADGSPRMARFWVDTGGGGFLLSERLAKDLGLELGAPIQAEGSEFAPVAPPKVRVGGMHLDLTGARCAAMIGTSSAFSGVDCEGLFPAHVLRRYHVVFDYPERSFSLAKPGAATPRGEALEAPVHEGSGFPRVELEIAGKKHGFLLDTGASFTMVSEAQIDAWSSEHPDWPTMKGAVGRANMIGGPMEVRGTLMRLPGAKLGGFTLAGPAVISRPAGTFEQYMSSMMAAPIIGALGGNVLREFRVEIDYAAGKVYLTRSEAQRLEHDMDLVGLTLHRELRGYAIDAVSSANDARVLAGVRPGDVLLRVDELEASGATLAQVVDALRGEPGQERKLQIEREGKTIEIVAPVVRIL